MITMYDVAKHANVSPMTVSRTLNKPELVRPESRARVEAAIAELGYRRNQAARSLVTHTTGAIKIQLTRGLRGNYLFFGQLFAGITEVLIAQKRAMLISDENTPDYAYDGKIMMGLTKEDCLKLPPSDTPRVLFGHGIPELDWIDFDNKAGGRLATEHLIHLGHHKIGFVYFYTPEDFIAEREQGYRDALNAVGLPILESASEGAYENTVEEGFNAGKRLLERADVTAIVCCSDQLASGVSQAAQSLGKQVPKDLSVVGFDGAGYERTGYPVLTTIKQPVFEIGKQLATHLLEMVDGKTNGQPKHYWFPPELLVNDSTAPNSE